MINKNHRPLAAALNGCSEPAIFVQFGRQTYLLEHSCWDSASQIGQLTICSNDGDVFQLESGGLLPFEIRQTIVAFALQRASETAACLDAV